MEAAARSGCGSGQILERARQADPGASTAEIRRAAIYALTDPAERDDQVKSRLHALAIDIR
ncbi:hypothetical protein D3874_07990 [Oleomonas cavernae]|uniref:Uncharacterized protein n=1 Tax=Oleomonas cavernae TaxID=2320859 RepID=A0A418WAD2_9PROT|nr:hypothetical protein D3874_07990 [Oleomonas cavernae]